MGHPDADPKLIGRNIHVMLSPLPVNKRKLRFHVREEPPVEAEEESAPAPALEPERAEKA